MYDVENMVLNLFHVIHVHELYDLLRVIDMIPRKHRTDTVPRHVDFFEVDTLFDRRLHPPDHTVVLGALRLPLFLFYQAAGPTRLRHVRSFDVSPARDPPLKRALDLAVPNHDRAEAPELTGRRASRGRETVSDLGLARRITRLWARSPTRSRRPFSHAHPPLLSR